MRLWPAVLALALGCSGRGPEAGAGSGSQPNTSPAAGAEPTDREAAARARSAASSAAAGSAASPTGSAASSAPAGSAASPAAGACRPLPFAAKVALAEASGAVWVEPSFGLPAHLVVVSDSGNRGDFAVLDAASGGQLAAGRLPLERGVTDDLEGLARSGGVYYALASNGYLRHYRRAGASRFELTVPAYPLPGASCRSPRANNCGRDFEGLCLADPLPASGCVGFAASRAEGELVCLERGEGGRLRPALDRSIRFALPMTLSDCNIAPAAAGHALHAVTNALGANLLYRVRGWRDSARAKVELLPARAGGFIEAVAAGPSGAIYRFSDTGAAPSAMTAESCPPADPE
jgi:hypothetical protein